MKLINVALAGCGEFVQQMHIPILLANPKFRISAVMDIDMQNAVKAAELTGASYWTLDYEKILNDRNVDLVFIGTRHDSHADLAIRAAEAGKNIFCEKPMGLSVNECLKVAEAVRKNKVKYSIGYNRGMAPMVRMAKDLMQGLDHKKLLYHRIQAPFSASHWIHDSVKGGGRFIGEGCHIFDLICEIVQEPPVCIYASGGIFLDLDEAIVPDSGIITITFQDGSVGCTLINSAGCSDFPKEATEIYCNNKTIYINNFSRMESYGFEGRVKTVIEYDKSDKGHIIELDSIANSILNDLEPPNGIDRAMLAAILSFKANESVLLGKPVAISKNEYSVLT
jgi:predicted dehydrogenase